MHRFVVLLSATAALAGAAAPNLLFILADDLDSDYKQDRLAIMPNLRTRIRDAGASFSNHVAAQPVCGPSRSSFLAGRYPHNTGYVNNVDEKSYSAWLKQCNNTIGSWLSAEGYHTAFLGKYVNGLENHPMAGWSHYGGLADTYTYFNATQWNCTGSECTGPISREGIHQSTFIGQQAVAQMQTAVGLNKPFFISLTALMVHWGSCYTDESVAAFDDPVWETRQLPCPSGGKSDCAAPISACPTPKNKHAADGLVNPHTPSWNLTADGDVPPAMVRALIHREFPRVCNFFCFSFAPHTFCYLCGFSTSEAHTTFAVARAAGEHRLPQPYYCRHGFR
jgi:hypothetical protein